MNTIRDSSDTFLGKIIFRFVASSIDTIGKRLNVRIKIFESYFDISRMISCKVFSWIKIGEIRDGQCSTNNFFLREI